MCETLITIANSCGKNIKDGVNRDVYLIAYSDLKNITGSTEVYSVAVSGLVDAISLRTGSTKFVKYGTVNKTANIKDTFAKADNGSFDITQEITFTLGDVSSVDTKNAVEKLINNPVAALVKLGNKNWVALGLGGQLELTATEGTAGTGTNGRTVTLSGSDSEFILPVDPTIIAGLTA